MITTVLMDDNLYESLRKYCFDNRLSISKAVRTSVKRLLDGQSNNQS